MKSIGRYQLVEKLGQGGMGVVYRAFDTLLQRVVAVKVIGTTVDQNPELRERFFREARAAGQLSHRNIITIYDLGEHEGQPYLAMEYLEGQDLQRRLGGPDRMGLTHKVDIAIEMCEGLEYAHNHGVVHRDIKPANVFITGSGTVKILDFGLARLVTSELTNSNMMMGTLNYMAPEQVRGERADNRSDIFSIGVVLYELLGGRRAFEGDSFAATLYKILQEVPEPLLKIEPALPPQLVAIVERALAKPRDERYQQMSEMLRDLLLYRQQVLFQDSPALGRPVPPGLRPASGGSRRSGPPISSSELPTIAQETPIPRTGSDAQQPPASGPALAALRGDSTRRRTAMIAAAAVVLTLGGAVIWNAARQEQEPPATGAVAGTTTSAPPAAEPRADPQPPAEAPLERRGTGSTGQGEPPRGTEPARPSVSRGSDRPAGGGSAATKPPRPPQVSPPATRGPAAPAARTPDTTAAAPSSRSTEPSQAARPRPDPAESRGRESRPAGDPPSTPPPGPPTAPERPAAPPPSSGLGTEKPGTTVSLPTIPVPAPPPAAAKPAPATEPSPPPPAPSAGIDELLARYEAALESRSLTALRRLWPGLGGYESAISSEFQNARNIDVDIIDPKIAVSGSAATVVFIRRYVVATVDNQRLRTETRTTMNLRRAGSDWVIEQIRFDPVR